MQLGMIGLGRMGANMVRRLLKGGHHCGVFDRSAQAAAELVKKHPGRAIEAKIEIFDWLVREQDERVRKNAAGYLLKSIEEDYATPKGFLARPVRQRRPCA